MGGHDSQLNALNSILGMGWESSPWPINATLPGSMLRFDREGDSVAASYWYPSDFSKIDGVMSKSKVSFSHSAGNTLSLSELKDRVERGTISACVNKWNHQEDTSRVTKDDDDS